MKNIILIAPPAAGKGTQAKLLCDKYNLVHISTGDLLRSALNNNDSLSLKIKEIMSSGKLVSDDIVLDLLFNKLEKLENTNGFILDGFPRNINQAKLYLDLVNKFNYDLKVIYINVPLNVLQNRILGRSFCLNCGNSYNEFIDDLKPKVDGVCDKCGTTLIKREDDNVQTFEKRYDEYIKETYPLIEFFDNINVLNEVSGEDTVSEIFSKISAIIDGCLND